MERILVALDGSAESEQILDQVLRIAGRGARIDLLHVVPTPDREVPGAGLNVEDLAGIYLEGVAERLEGREVRTFVWRGAPEEEIPKAARSLNADLLALTTHGRRGLSHLLMGSVAEVVVRNAPVPVLMTRPGVTAPPRPVERILVPFDGSEASGELFEPVRSLAADHGAEILLLQVRTRLAADVTPLGFPASSSGAGPTLEEQVHRLQGSGLRVSPVVARGNPAAQILIQARKLQVDLIAMATAGRKGLSRILLGSVSEEVVRRMDRAVVLHRVASDPEAVRRIQEQHAPGSD